MSSQTKNLNKLLEEVTQDVVELLAKSEAPLAKADPGEEAPGESTPGGSSTEGSEPAEASPDAGGGETPPPAGGDAPPPEAPAPGDEQTQDPAQDASPDPQALVAEYAKLPPEELKLHFMACHAALMQVMGGDAGAGGDPAAQEGAPADAPAPGPEGTPPPGEQSMQPGVQKAELKAPAANGGTEKAVMAKSEIVVRLDALEKGLKGKDLEIAAKEKTIQDLEKKLDEAVVGVTRFLEKTTGLRKSISGVSFDKKPGDEPQFREMSKSEAVAKLNQLTAGPGMKSEDRKLVNQYVIGGAPQSTVAHLLGNK